MIALLLTALALNPCSLLDAATIARVQGAEPKETKASEHPDGPFTARQCFFTLPDFVRSVSLEVTQLNPGSKSAELRKRWAQLSGKDEAVEKERREEREAERAREPGRTAEEEGARPRRVPGVGKAAVWAGDAHVGALYALGANDIVRVSVGGAGDVAAKIKACSALARSALRRLAQQQSARPVTRGPQTR